MKVMREKKVYVHGCEIVRFDLKGTLSYEVKHPCSCCPAHTVTVKVHNSGSTGKNSDPAADYIETFTQFQGKYYNGYKNIHWVGTPVVTKEPFFEEVEEEPPCTCRNCKVTIKTESGKTEIEIEGVPV